MPLDVPVRALNRFGVLSQPVGLAFSAAVLSVVWDGLGPQASMADSSGCDETGSQGRGDRSGEA